mgnify:CR=1 FL=1
MLSNEYLFPVRKTRRDFLAAGAAFTLATSGLLALDKDESKNSLKLEVDPTWGKLPSGMKFGLGCAVVVDGKDRIIVTSRSTNPCVAIFDIKGTLLETWDKDISSRIGYDQAQFNAGAEGQGTMWTDAQALGMTWSWAAGYKFVKFEGTVTSATHTDANYRVHTGKTGDVYNYAEVVLDLPDNALVRTNITPQVHIMADLKKIVDGTTVINFEEGLDVMGGTKVQNISANNVPTMFEVHHVHND